MNRLEKLKRVDNLLLNAETTKNDDEAITLMNTASDLLIEILDEQNERKDRK